jgi:hypothetical protein
MRLPDSSWLFPIPVIKMFYPQLVTGNISMQERPIDGTPCMPRSIGVVDIRLHSFFIQGPKRQPKLWSEQVFWSLNVDCQVSCLGWGGVGWGGSRRWQTAAHEFSVRFVKSAGIWKVQGFERCRDLKGAGIWKVQGLKSSGIWKVQGFERCRDLKNAGIWKVQGFERCRDCDECGLLGCCRYELTTLQLHNNTNKNNNKNKNSKTKKQQTNKKH